MNRRELLKTCFGAPIAATIASVLPAPKPKTARFRIKPPDYVAFCCVWARNWNGEFEKIYDGPSPPNWNHLVKND